MKILTIYALTLMTFLQPHAPWMMTYPQTAHDMAETVIEKGNLFEGKYGNFKTITLFVAVAKFESNFNPGAIGDHGAAHGPYQAHGYGALEKDSKRAAAVAWDMFRQSFKACASRPVDERLGWYAAGGNDCERGLKESRHRMNLAKTLFAKFKPKDEE